MSSFCPTMGHIVLDLTSLTHQPKSRERSAHPKRLVTFAMSEQKISISTNLWCVQTTPLSLMTKMISLPATRKELVKDKCDRVADRRSLHQSVRRSKGPPVLQDPTVTLEQEVSGNSRERSEDVSGSGRKAEGESLRSIMSMLSDERILRDLHLKHYPRPDRSRVSGLRAEVFGDLIFLDHGSSKIGDRTY